MERSRETIHYLAHTAVAKLVSDRASQIASTWLAAVVVGLLTFGNGGNLIQVGGKASRYADEFGGLAKGGRYADESQRRYQVWPQC